jgi:hypothetical protein
VSPAWAGAGWLVLVPLGVITGFFLVPRAAAKRQQMDWRYFGLAPILFAFIAGTYAVMSPVSGEQQAAFIPLLVGAIYAGMGLWLGVRFIIAGAVVTALTLGGYFWLHEHFQLWMAFVGGGALILAGLWFRRV